MAKNDFPVYLDLKEYFSDHRSHAKILVKKVFKTIADLEDKISGIFGITKFYLVSGDHFLPSCEPITLVENGDTVCVKPISEESSAIVLAENYYVNRFEEHLWDNNATTPVSKAEFSEEATQKKRKTHDHLFSSTPNDKTIHDKSDSEQLLDKIAKKKDRRSRRSEKKEYVEICDDAIKKKSKKRKQEIFADNVDDDVSEIPKKRKKSQKKVIEEQIDEMIVQKQQFKSKDEENSEDNNEEERDNYVKDNPKKRSKKFKKSHKKDVQEESQDRIDETTAYEVENEEFEQIHMKNTEDNKKIKKYKFSKSDKNKEHSDLSINSPETSKCKKNTQSNVNIIQIDILNAGEVIPTINNLDRIKLPPDNKETPTKQRVDTQDELKKYERKPLCYIKARDIKSWSTEPLPKTTNLVKIIKVPIITASSHESAIIQTSNLTIVEVYPENIEQYKKKSEINDPVVPSEEIGKKDASNSTDCNEKITELNSETSDEISEGTNVKCKSEILISWRQKILEKTGQLEKNRTSNLNSGASSDSNEDIKNIDDVEAPKHENLNSKVHEETKEEVNSKIEEFKEEVINFNKLEEFSEPNISMEVRTDTESHTHDTSDNIGIKEAYVEENSQFALSEMDESSEIKRKRKRKHKKKINTNKTFTEVTNNFHQENTFYKSSKPRIHIRFDDNEIDQYEPKENLIVENEISQNGTLDTDCEHEIRTSEALKSSQPDEHEEEKTDILNFPESTNSTDPEFKKAIDQMKAELLRAFDELCVKQSPS